MYTVSYIFFPQLNDKMVFSSSEVHLTHPNHNTHSWNSIHLYW